MYDHIFIDYLYCPEQWKPQVSTRNNWNSPWVHKWWFIHLSSSLFPRGLNVSSYSSSAVTNASAEDCFSIGFTLWEPWLFFVCVDKIVSLKPNWHKMRRNEVGQRSFVALSQTPLQTPSLHHKWDNTSTFYRKFLRGCLAWLLLELKLLSYPLIF